MPTLLRLIEEPKRSVAGGAMARLLAGSPSEGTVEAVGARLLKAAPGEERRWLLSSLRSTPPGWVLPAELVPVVARVVRESEQEWERKFAFELLAAGGEPGRAALVELAVEGPLTVEAALAADSHKGTTIDACVLALKQGGHSAEGRIQLFGRIRIIVERNGVPAPAEHTASVVAELYKADPEPRPRWFAAQALARAGPPGRKALGALLLGFPDDDSEQAKQLGAALAESVRHDTPPGFDDLRTSWGSVKSTPTQRRVWAQAQAEE